MSTTTDVLIVEDDIVVREQIAALLAEEGFDVRQAANGLAGLREIREGIPDLLISDLSMPVMDGIELIEEIVLEYPMLPVIVLSDGNAMSEVAKMLRLGVKDFLLKPLKGKKSLIKSIQSVIKESLNCANHDNDFCQQWFNVSEFASDPVAKELSKHLNELLSRSANARELLLGLLPEPDSKQGNWQLNYHMLQSIETDPLVLDYAWMQEGKLAFYLVDSASAGKNAVATTLMIRAFFNAFLRTASGNKKALHHLVNKIEHAIKGTNYTSPVRVIFGLLNTTNGQLELISAGLTPIVEADNDITLAENEALLGSKKGLYQAQTLWLKQNELSMSLCNAALNRFLLTIKRLDLNVLEFHH